MRSTIRCTPFAAAVLLLACEGTAPPAPPPGNFGLRTAVWVPGEAAVIVEGAHSGFQESVNRVIADESAWADAWTQLNTFQLPVPPRPVVDFGVERVVLVALGERPSSGYGIGIDSMVSFEHGTLVYATTVRPAGDCVLLTVMTNPVSVVRISPIPPQPVEFRRSGTVHHCS